MWCSRPDTCNCCTVINRNLSLLVNAFVNPSESQCAVEKEMLKPFNTMIQGSRFQVVLPLSQEAGSLILCRHKGT